LTSRAVTQSTFAMRPMTARFVDGELPVPSTVLVQTIDPCDCDLAAPPACTFEVPATDPAPAAILDPMPMATDAASACPTPDAIARATPDATACATDEATACASEIPDPTIPLCAEIDPAPATMAAPATAIGQRRRTGGRGRRRDGRRRIDRRRRFRGRDQNGFIQCGNQAAKDKDATKPGGSQHGGGWG